MHTSTNIHDAHTVSAETLDCARGTGREFTSLRITIKCDVGSFDACLIGLPADYARRLAAAIDAVPVRLKIEQTA